MATDTDSLTPEQAAMKERMRLKGIEERRRISSLGGKALQEKKRMEASVTTLNISGPEPMLQDPLALQALEASAPAASETITVPATLLADLQAQIAELREVRQVASGMSFEQLKFFIEEMKKPDAETAAKLAAEKERRESERKNMIELAILEEQEKQNREANCGHRKENGRTAYVLGHRNEDGKYKYLCQHCQKCVESTLPPERFGVVTEGRVAFGPGNPLGQYEVQVQ